MCGLVGVVDLEERGRVPAPEVFDRMVDALERRGPDGRGVSREGSVALGHRRLAVLDPSAAGAQPMRHPTRSVVVTYNGEIYNFRELRSDLEGRGHRFTTRTDTEVLLAAYLEWGTRAIERLNGIFAFALWDAAYKRLWLARDPLGVKPLFYRLRAGVVSFASELKALLEDPSFERVPNLEAIDGYLSLAYVPAPLTAFEGVLQLPPAHQLVLEAGQPAAPERYWRPTLTERRISTTAAREELGARLRHAVERQMVSDVPLGGFLSGGLDSAALVAEMVKLAGERVKTFSIGFHEASFDESGDAERTASLLGSEHHAERLTLDLAREVERFAAHSDDLFADSSVLAVDHLCALARRHVTVSLSGDGADELLAGYPTYLATYLSGAWRRAPARLRRLARRAVERLPPSDARYNKRDFGLRFLDGSESGPGRDHASWRRYLSEVDKDALVRREGRRRSDVIGRYAAALDEAGDDATLLKRMLYADLTFYLPSDMLVKVDRASMRHGLEVRVPFLDTELVDFCLSLPTPLLLGYVGRPKHLLREHLRANGASEVARRKKRGFNVPIGAALKGPLGALLLDALASEPFRSSGPIDPHAAERLYREHVTGRTDAAAQLYVVLVLALWWRRWLSA